MHFFGSSCKISSKSWWLTVLEMENFANETLTLSHINVGKMHFIMWQVCGVFYLVKCIINYQIGIPFDTTK